MSALVKISRVGPSMTRIGVQGRHYYYKAGPAREKISLAEKISHGLFLTCGIMAYPIWTMYDVHQIRAARWAAEEAEEN